ncbi:MAG: ABC transporter substrate-binding protein [Rhodoferax sp.]|nr:ABC transporter substrate-binding protein [Rhodoferax sp.]
MVLPMLSPRQRLLASLAITVLAAVGAWALIRFLSPDPPRVVQMSTGAPDGAYHQFALKYQRVLRDNGITLELQPSSGSVENLQRLQQGRVAVGLVQGGLGPGVQDPLADNADTPLRTLATVSHEPLWVFSHTLNLDGGLGALKGRRVAVGAPGSGNRQLAMQLLATYGLVDAQGRWPAGTELLDLGGVAAANALQAQQIDAVILVAAAQAPAVARLLDNPNIRLAALDHVEGLARRFPFFQPVVLRRGAIDPARDIPPRDIPLLSTTANLVVQDSLHPALGYLLLEAARATHAGPGLFHRQGEFPSPVGTDFPLAEEADRYFKNGRPFLQRYLPFWVANFVQRLVLTLLPLVAILVPVFKFLPALLHWKERNRLFRRYGELKFLERDIDTRTLSDDEKAQALLRLDAIEAEIRHARFALDFSDRVYTLRQHVDYVRRRLDG